MALVHIGEVGVHWAEGSAVLRPSLLAISRIGTPSEIVATLACVFGEGLRVHVNPEFTWHDRKAARVAMKQQLRASLEVWQACAPDGFDVDAVTGYFSERGGWRMGALDPQDVVLVAQALLRHGVLGDPDEPSEEAEPAAQNEEFEPLFDCRKHAATAMGHLGLSEAEAWNLTMTGLRLAIEAKYPKPETPEQQSARRAPAVSEYDVTMAWFDKVQQARA